MIILLFFPIKIINNIFSLNFLILIFILGITLFTLIFRSFFSFRKFRIISSKRFISQILSYEIGLMIIFIFIILINLNINLELIIINIKMKFNILNFIFILFLFIVILGESRRTPFDFIESESELISGFNTEFSRSYFSLFFIYEYGIILFFSLLLRLIFINFILCLILIFIFINIRASFPRLRYDQIIYFF
jgi:NADH:ubiquinone oxidoreductase subunit H